jgi:hypothetical protein
MASVQETAIIYAALILQDEKIEITVSSFYRTIGNFTYILSF